MAITSFTPLADAINAWQEDPRESAIITFADGGTYDETEPIIIAMESDLIIRADQRKRPHVRLHHPITFRCGATEGKVLLEGLLVESVRAPNPENSQAERDPRQAKLKPDAAFLLKGDMRLFELRHTTIVPGARLPKIDAPDKNKNSTERENGSTNLELTSIHVFPSNTSLTLAIDSCIVGRVQAPREIDRLRISDSIVDGLLGRLDTIASESIEDDSPAEPVAGMGGRRNPDNVADPSRLTGFAILPESSEVDSSSGPVAEIERSTILGATRFHRLFASNSIFVGKVTVNDRQAGCVRLLLRFPRLQRLRRPSGFDVSPNRTTTIFAHDLPPRNSGSTRTGS